MPKWLIVIRTFLGKLTDALVAGRAVGLWQQKDKVNVEKKGLEK